MNPLYHIKPNTYHKAFVLAAIVASLISGLTVEMHDRNLFNLYRRPEESNEDIVYNISITVLIAGIIAYIGSWVARLLFGYGSSSLVK